MPVHLERHDRVAVITLDDPERRNAMTAPLVAEILTTMDALDADPEVGAVVVTGAGPAFCSGADVNALKAMADGTEEPADVRDIYAGFLRILDSPLPTIAAVNGPAVGAGLNLALACDVRIASTSAIFDARFLRIGIHPGGGNTWLLDRAVGPQTTAAMNLFGARIDGRRAAEVGLAWECVADDALLPRSIEMATRAGEVARELSVRTKATLRHTPTIAEHDTAMRFELEHQVWSLRSRFAPAPKPR
ncbi:MAG: enoyl-CoA hydratase [Acidimicrobiia bacterium]|nr:enoyl-CoA hydratase [Acidimicrobiia bacterium]